MKKNPKVPEHVVQLISEWGWETEGNERHYFNMTDEFRTVFPTLFELLTAGCAYVIRRRSETGIVTAWQTKNMEPFGWVCDFPWRSSSVYSNAPNEFRVLNNIFGGITGWLGVEIALPFGDGEFFFWNRPGMGADADRFIERCKFANCRITPDPNSFIICGVEANGDKLLHDLKTSRVYIVSYGTGPIGDSDILVPLKETPILYEVKGAGTFRELVEFVAGEFLSLLDE